MRAQIFELKQKEAGISKFCVFPKKNISKINATQCSVKIQILTDASQSKDENSKGPLNQLLTFFLHMKKALFLDRSSQ